MTHAMRRGRASDANLAASKAAECFQGLPYGYGRADLVYLVENNGKEIGVGPAAIAHYRFLVIRWTQDRDWNEPGERPVVFLRVDRTAEERGLSEARVRQLEYELNEAGLLTWTDRGDYHRSGVRDDEGHDPGGSPKSKSNPPFDRPFQQDTDEDRIKEIYEHHRPPLEANVKVLGGAEFHVLLVHAKSKGIFRAVDLVRLQRESERNRRKLLAEACSIRRRVDDWLDAGRDFLVMGDVNDGPGMDFYEQLFGRSALEIIMGDVFQPDRILRNLAGRPRWGQLGWRPSSARFRDRMTHDHINVLIDHVLHSPKLKASGHRIWNPFELEEAKPIKRELLDASDHFPVSVDLC